MKKESNIIAIVGMCGSGKSELTAFFVRDGFQSIHFGDVTQIEMKRRGLPICEANERLVREDVRRQYGLGAYAVLLLPEILKQAEAGRVVLDGLYSWSEYKFLREKLGDRLKIAAVVTGAGIRKKRLASRSVRPLTEAEVNSRDASEIENLEKGGPIAIADFYLDNNGPLEALEAQYNALRKATD